jgi:hypothetical protein
MKQRKQALDEANFYGRLQKPWSESIELIETIKTQFYRYDQTSDYLR